MFLLCLCLSVLSSPPLASGLRHGKWGYLPKYWHQNQFVPSAEKMSSIRCPDQSTCLDHDTCCLVSSGNYGCCPFPKALCCSDHIHCCPAGTTCDVAKGKCNNTTASIPWFEKSQARSPISESIVCPDGKSQCPEGKTCCLGPFGKYGCCPLPNAVCCSDQLHCCPKDTTCDLSEAKCNGAKDNIPWFHKRLSRMETERSVVCPGGHSQCPTGQTCCMSSTGQYGCCPMPKAVCCSDHLHCCPNGTICGVAQGKCNRGKLSISWFEKQPSTPVKVKEVICPDEQSRCPDGSTCCKLASGEYGCCPFPKAVCCPDHLHCCPEGTTCDEIPGRCQKGRIKIPWLETAPSSGPTLTFHKCPDGKSQCAEEQTCCLKRSGEYGCCDLPNAVCCSDHVHCCQSGTTCDYVHKKCKRRSLLWFVKWDPDLLNSMMQPVD